MTRRESRLAEWTHLASLAAAAAAILWLRRRGWFFFDEWEFLANRIAPGHLQLFEPHLEHWSTVPILIYRALYGLVGLHSYVPYLAVLVGLHLGIAHLVWRVLRRAGVNPWLGAALPLPLLFLGASPENLVWAFQVSYLGSVLFGLVHVLLADHTNPFGRRDVAGWVAGVLALMSSGLGLTFVAVATLTALFRRGPRSALAAAAVPYAVYAVWFLAAGRRGVAAGDATVDSLLGLPRYVWSALTTTAEQSTGLAGAGVVLITGVAFWLLRRADLVRSAPVPFAAALGSLVLFGLIGAVRLRYGDGVAPRYLYPGVVLLLPAAGMALNALVGRHAVRRVAAVSLLALSAVSGAGQLRAAAHVWNARDTEAEQRILAAAQLVRAGAPLVGADPEPTTAPDLTVAKLRTLVAQQVLPPNVPITSDAQLFAAAQLQIGSGASVPAGTPPAALVIRGVSEVQVAARPGGACADFTPTGPHPEVIVTFDALGIFTVVQRASDGVHLLLTSASGATKATSGRAFPTVPGADLSIAVTAEDAKLVLQLPQEGEDSLCAAAISRAG